ncbi:MAG: DUF4214 domain-containing protein [Janthinobacterium lividum]
MIDDFLGNEHTQGRLDTGGSARGKIQYAHDEDWFTVTLQAGVTYRLTAANSGTLDFGIAFYDLVWQGVAAATVAGWGETELCLEFTPERSGTYYALAASVTDNFAINDYTLRLAPRGTPDDLPASRATGGVLTLDAPARGTFEERGDVDWFRFHAEQGFHYGFVADPEVQPELGVGYLSWLQVVGPDGGRVETPGAGFNPQVSGDYYIAVRGAAVGAYSLAATGVADDFGETSANSGRLTDGGTAAGRIDYELDQDWFRVDFEEGRFYTVVLQGVQDYVYGLRLLDAQGKLLDYASAFVHDGLRLTYRAEAGGPAFVAIDRGPTVRPAAEPTPYTLALTSAADDIGHDAAGARPLELNGSADGSLQGRVDRDAFRITLEAGVSYRFALSADGDARSLKLDLSALADPTILATATTGTQGALDFTPARGGDYLVTVASDGGLDPGMNYTLGALAAADDWAANAAGAGRLAVGAGASGRLDNRADRDWFALQLAPGTAVWLEAALEPSMGLYATVRIFDASGRQVGPDVAASDGRPFLFTPEGQGHAPADYYVEISSQYGNGAYTLSTAAWLPDDAGDTVARATPIAVGSVGNWRIDSAQDRDVFRLDVVAGEVYGVVVGEQWSWDRGVRMLDADGEPIAGIVGDGSAHLSFTASYTGAVYASVGGAPGDYRLETRVYHDPDPDGIGAAARVLAEGASIGAALDHLRDHDVFRMRLDADRPYVVKLAADGPGDLPQLALLSEGGRHHARVEQSLQNGERILKIWAQAAGDYFLDVSASGTRPAAYTLTALPFAGDGQGPALVGQSHPDGAAGVPLTANTITLRFSEAIVADLAQIVLRDADGKVMTPGYGRDNYPMIKDDTLVLKLQTHLAPGSYTLSLPADSIHDKDGNRYTGPETIGFTTVLPTATADAGNGLYLASPGTVVDGGAGIDTYYVGAHTLFVHVQRSGDGFVVVNTGTGEQQAIRNIERLQFPMQIVALDIDGVAGQAYRLYQAAFDRKPDDGGLGFWIGQMDRGMSLQTVAQAFVDSPEFVSMFAGAPSDETFVRALYQNVLHRSPDPEGFTFWNWALQNGVSRAEVLMHFSESPENSEALADIIGHGFHYMFA